jgi:TatD DNase family protein
MLVDTHCHINIMVKKDFDVPLNEQDLVKAKEIINESYAAGTTIIINVGTSLIESENCILLSKKFPAVYAAVGIHPNDLTSNWRTDLKKIAAFIKEKEENKIVGIGECGYDFHYPEYNKQQQEDAFKTQIEMSLENNLALVVHTRDASQETLKTLDEYHKDLKRVIIHCFSENEQFAQQVTSWGFAIGIGGIITYPKNEYLRNIVKSCTLDKIVLETDAPFLPIQSMRGKQNHPQYIKQIAQFIAQLRNESFDNIADQTTKNARRIFKLE